jgi:hypothetical protein
MQRPGPHGGPPHLHLGGRRRGRGRLARSRGCGATGPPGALLEPRLALRLRQATGGCLTPVRRKKTTGARWRLVNRAKSDDHHDGSNSTGVRVPRRPRSRHRGQLQTAATMRREKFTASIEDRLCRGAEVLFRKLGPLPSPVTATAATSPHGHIVQQPRYSHSLAATLADTPPLRLQQLHTL